MEKIGLTGGIGSGKSTVAGILSRLGARVIDADAISRSITAPEGAGIVAIAEAFGSGAITANGALDRDQMRRLVFSDPGAKILLERIVHPLVAQQIALQTAQAQEDGVRCLVLDIPLLVESVHWRKSLDRILVVDCPVATQVERVVRRNGLARSEVERIIEAQSTRQQRLQAADFVIFNAEKSLGEIAGELAWLGAQFGL
jgi:dephospho-CoA kinase